MRNATAFVYGEPVVIEEELFGAGRRLVTGGTEGEDFNPTPYEEAFAR